MIKKCVMLYLAHSARKMITDMCNIRMLLFFCSSVFLAGCQSFILGDLPEKSTPESKSAMQMRSEGLQHEKQKSVIITARKDKSNRMLVVANKKVAEDLPYDKEDQASKTIASEQSTLDKKISSFFSQIFSKTNDQPQTSDGGSTFEKQELYSLEKSITKSETQTKPIEQTEVNPSKTKKVERRYSAAYGVYFPLAKKGHAFAQYEMALMYLHGYGVPSDAEKAKKWFRKAALQGHTDAKTELDQLSSGKKLVLRNRKAVIPSSSDEITSTVIISADTVTVTQDAPEYGIEEPTQLGNSQKQAPPETKAEQAEFAGRIPNFNSIKRVKPTPRSSSLKKVRISKKTSAMMKDKEAEYENRSELNKTLPKRLTPSQNTDKPKETKFNMAQLPSKGPIKEASPAKQNTSFNEGLSAFKNGDFKKAFEHWYPLAEEGNAESQNRLGYLYEHGKGVKRDYKKAVKWYLKAAEKNEPAAQFNLGVMYRKGHGVKKDDKLARTWYEKAAKQGHPIAERVVEVMRAYKIGE